VTNNKPIFAKQLAQFAPLCSLGKARRGELASTPASTTGKRGSVAAYILSKRGFAARALHSDLQALPDQD